MSFDATRLRGDGSKITLADGEVVELIFDFDALCEVEEIFGSLAGFTLGLAQGSRMKIMQTVVGGVAAALRHLDEPPTTEQVRRRLDSRRTNEYVDALDEAFARSMPEPAEDAEAGAGKDSGETTDSPGTPGTSSSRSTTSALPVSSGE